MRRLLFLTALASCASATGARIDDASSQPLDAPVAQHDAPTRASDAPRVVDAPHVVVDAAVPIDAPVGESAILTQTQPLFPLIISSSLGCEDEVTTGTFEQAYYRVFSTVETFQLSSVTFAVLSMAGTATITVNVGAYSAAPGTALSVGANDWGGGDVTPLATATVALDDNATDTFVSVPITATVPAGRLIVEVLAPDETTDNDAAFFLGAARGAQETVPAYWWSPACAVAPPQTPSSLGEGPGAFVIMAAGDFY